MEELNSVERSFSDLHRRYDKMKTMIEGYQRNEEKLKVRENPVVGIHIFMNLLLHIPFHIFDLN